MISSTEEDCTIITASKQYELGILYFEKGKLDKATSFFRLSANQGYHKAQVNLGTCYLRGYGVKQDFNKAIELFKLASEQGNPVANFNLGLCYDEGFGVEPDLNKAIEFYKLSSEQGYSSFKIEIFNQIKKISDKLKQESEMT